MTSFRFWPWSFKQARNPRYQVTRALFLRGLALVYLAAFGSLAVQLDGLIGSHGILPAAEFLEQAGRVLGPGTLAYFRLPTLFWLGASDQLLHAVCWGGLLLSAVLLAGILPGYCAALLWAFYLSLTVASQVFLGYQWDSLLLETGFLAILIAPWGLLLSRAGDRPWWFSIWLVRWLAFRLMFRSAVVKLASLDPTWRAWTALESHYQTQPIPTWTSWYIHQMPPWFHSLSVGFMFYAELIAPFFIFGPRPLRVAGFTSLVLLQVLIAATGNYGFFNLLSVVICLCILDDRDFEWLIGLFPRLNVLGRFRGAEPPAAAVTPADRTEPGPPSIPKRLFGQPAPERAPAGAGASVTDRPWLWPRRLVVGFVGAIILTITASQTIETIWPEAPIPSELVMLDQWAEPFRSTNGYGLFAVMTTKRPEIIVEGSDDGASWKPYRFRWKPCELDRAPRFSFPHLPRLDWQMWFAALAGDCQAVPWFIRFEQKLLEGSPEVLGLLRENPFPDRPPRYLRARLYLYRFTTRGSADWWSRGDDGFFCPPLSLDAFAPFEGVPR